MPRFTYDGRQAREIGVRINFATHGGRRMNSKKKARCQFRTMMNPWD
jgi:hypothetical protein